MKKIYFIGGGNLAEGELKNIDKIYIEESNNKSIFILDITTNDKVKIQKYKEFLKKYFTELGARKLSFLSEDNLSTLTDQDIVYLPGGDTLTLIDNLRKYGLKEILKKFEGTIVGNSAGALVICEKVIITKDDKNPKTIIAKGLGIVNFSVEVHYEESKHVELNKVRKNLKVYAIPEKSALIYAEKKISSIGKIFELG